jgi:hypothetical protein
MKANVLICFVTTSEPRTSKGLASIVTAARALAPAYIHLLFTDDTRENCKRTKEALREFATLRTTKVVEHRLRVPDARDVVLMVEALRYRLPQIKREHRGHFHLVSGHPAVRLAMALCISAGEIDGVVYNVDEPANKDDVSQAKCEARLRVMDINVLRRFLRDTVDSHAKARLRIDLAAHQARLDGKLLELRAKTSEKTGERHHASFDILTTLAARRLFGSTDSTLTAAQLSQAAYGVRTGQTVDVWRRVQSLNNNAERITRRKPNPISALVVPAQARPKGVYRLTDELDTCEIVFEQSDEAVSSYIVTMDLGDFASLFPYLPRLILP